jgi:hypothetical protein
MNVTKKAFAAFALMLALVGCFAFSSPASASVDGMSSCTLYTDGGTDEVGANWKVYVEVPAALGLDADYWNLTIYADPINASATNATYYAHVYINDGATNITKNVTIAAKNDVRVYSNASFAAADYTSLVVNKESATVYVTLCNAGGTVVDHYQSGIMIYEQEYLASMVTLIYVIVPIMILFMLFGYLKGGSKGLFGK